MRTLSEVHDPDQKESICRSTLSALPLWFGITESNEEYARGVRDLPFLAVFDQGSPLGFIAFRVHHAFTAEVYLLAVLPEAHRQGIGTQLVEWAVDHYQARDFRFLQVKTLDESRESEEYRTTRLFYRRMGFYPLETIPEIWGPENPCLIMVRALGPQGRVSHR